jgi:hypothetical protein
MLDLPQPLLGHLKQEEKDARELASREENEKQIAASCQPPDEGRTPLQCLKNLNYEM